MKMTIEKNGHVFECRLTSDFHGKMCCVEISKVVRPTWKIFRTSYCGSEAFWIDDYNTIAEGVERMVECFLKDWEEDEVRRAKWETLSK